MLADPEVFRRPVRIVGRLVAWCAAVTVPLLAAGCGGGSAGVARSGSSSTTTVTTAGTVTGRATVTIKAAKQYRRIAGFGVSEGFGQAKDAYERASLGSEAGAELALQPDPRGGPDDLAQ